MLNTGLELMTPRLRVECCTEWASQAPLRCLFVSSKETATYFSNHLPLNKVKAYVLSGSFKEDFSASWDNLALNYVSFSLNDCLSFLTSLCKSWRGDHRGIANLSVQFEGGKWGPDLPAAVINLISTPAPRGYIWTHSLSSFWWYLLNRGLYFIPQQGLQLGAGRVTGSFCEAPR